MTEEEEEEEWAAIELHVIDAMYDGEAWHERNVKTKSMKSGYTSKMVKVISENTFA